MRIKKVIKLLMLFVFIYLVENIDDNGFIVTEAATYERVVIDGVEWSYSVKSDDSVSIVIGDAQAGYECLKIPSKINGHLVTSIDEYAFCDCDVLREIYIPETIESIGKYAFTGCTSLTDIYFGGTAVAWDRLKLFTENGNYFLQCAGRYYFLSPIVKGRQVSTSNEGRQEISIDINKSECYIMEDDRWDTFGELSFQWYYSENDSTENGILIEDATQCTYTANLYDTNYYYYCIVTNTYNHYSVSKACRPIQVEVGLAAEFWYEEEREIDHYGNTGTEEEPYEIKTSYEFSDFLECLRMGIDFEDKYIIIAMEEEEEIDLLNLQYGKELLLFAGHLEGNGSSTLYLHFGDEYDPLSIEDLEYVKNILMNTNNIILEQANIYVEDFECIDEWYNWYYMIACEKLEENNCQLMDFNIYLAE